jgi:ubiquitin-protein ligase
MEPTDDQISTNFIQITINSYTSSSSLPRGDFHGCEKEDLKEPTEMDYFFPLLLDEDDDFSNPDSFQAKSNEAPYFDPFISSDFFADDEFPENPNDYSNRLSNLKMQMSEWPTQPSQPESDSSPLSPEGLSRITKEIKTLSKSLPCESSGAIFVHFDSSNLRRLKVLVSGSEDSPYEHGLYLFEVKLDASYPSTPPKVLLKTTGQGTFRFNPNLYETGFVCLSIINTWAGAVEEMWNPSLSSLLQVFISIQALVMNNDIIQKEPGFASVKTDSIENQDYSMVVRYGNLAYAMIEMIRNPPVEFRDVVFNHFALKRGRILRSVRDWIRNLKKIRSCHDSIVFLHNCTAVGKLLNDPMHEFKVLAHELRVELDKLTDIG